jgi:hypothetical protein
MSVFAMPWSGKTYGPDGPCQAVQVGLGNPAQRLDLYPGGTWQSMVITSAVCQNAENQPSCYAQQAGAFDPSRSSTALTNTESGVFKQTSYWDGGDIQNITGDAIYCLENLSIDGTINGNRKSLALHNFSTLAFTEMHKYRADGTSYPVTVGNLALGAPNANQSWPGGTNGSLLTGTIQGQGITSSSSAGLHIGSVTLRLPGSLYLGGYDQQRVIGPVSTQPYARGERFPIALLDVGIGVAEGGSPFSFDSKVGLLAQGNSSLAPGVSVNVDATEPYLFLPESTCQAVAGDLPVTYSLELGLFLWNIADPLYQQITKSPACLSFTFGLNSSVSRNFSVNMPFILLDLNLSAPLVTSPTPYFPCSLPSLPAYTLGRAFLQAAFLGVNWMTNFDGVWFLAQTPGPRIPPAARPIEIGAADRFIEPSTQAWTDTWDGIWKVIGGANSSSSAAPANSSGSDGGPSAGSGKVSVATLAGGVLGGMFFLIIALFVALLACRRRRKRSSKQKFAPPSIADHSTDQTDHETLKAELQAQSITHSGWIRNGKPELDAQEPFVARHLTEADFSCVRGGNKKAELEAHDLALLGDWKVQLSVASEPAVRSPKISRTYRKVGPGQRTAPISQNQQYNYMHYW